MRCLRLRRTCLKKLMLKKIEALAPEVPQKLHKRLENSFKTKGLSVTEGNGKLVRPNLRYCNKFSSKRNLTGKNLSNGSNKGW